MSHLRPLGRFCRCAPSLFLLLLVWLKPTPAHAFFSEIVGYLKQYQLGLDYATATDSVQASYDIAHTGGPTPGCVLNTKTAGQEICSVGMPAGGSSGFGLILQQAFKRQGFWYFHPDVSFGARYLNGAMSQADVQTQAANGLPLTQLSFTLGAAVVKPYIEFGITPAGWFPDILITLGPAAQVALGNVSVNKQKKSVAVATSSSGIVDGFFNLEIVFLRFGKAGALSIYGEHDISGTGTGSKLYPSTVAGMSDFRATFGSTDAGLRLITNFP